MLHGLIQLIDYCFGVSTRDRLMTWNKSGLVHEIDWSLVFNMICARVRLMIQDSCEIYEE